MSNRWNILEERLIRVRTVRDPATAMTLPEVLGSLTVGDEIVGFRALRHHQRHAWFAFLVQLSAMALHRAKLAAPPPDPAEWRRLILGLAGDDEAAFTLVFEDLSRPAFMQPPVPAKAAHPMKAAGSAPDALDVLLTSKNHDLKAERLGTAHADQWLLTLVTLQTMDGYLGRGNYGIVRMNGGRGNRPYVGLTPAVAWGSRYRRDVAVLLGAREELVRENGFNEEGRHALLWLVGWDGSEAERIRLTECDPFFIEVCRRVRLLERDGVIVAFTSPTEAPRTDDGDRKGVLGDPWTPIDRDAEPPKALTLPESGFDYRQTLELLVGGRYEPGRAQRVRPGDPDDLVFHAETLVRGQGKTGGYHVRLVPIPARVRRTLGSRSERERLRDLGRQWIELAATVRNKVLKPALLAYLQGGPGELNFKDDRADGWTSALDRQIDGIYFDSLFEVSDEEDLLAASAAWTRAVLELARGQLDDAMRRSPVASVRRYRAEHAAWRTFHGSARRKFPDLFTEGHEGGVHHVHEG
jgi:CRISPR system Cascade subunit CasA